MSNCRKVTTRGFCKARVMFFRRKDSGLDKKRKKEYTVSVFTELSGLVLIVEKA